MAIWIQSISWTLIYGLGQGFIVYASLWLVLKLVPAASSAIRYHLSLSALTVLLAWFIATWWQQFHILTLASEHKAYFFPSGSAAFPQSLAVAGFVESYNDNNAVLSAIKIIFPWLSACYIAGLVFMLVRLFAGMSQLFSLKNDGVSQPGSVLTELMATLTEKIQYEGSVKLLISARAHVPMVLGFFKPIILMPAATIAQLSAQQLETIILHELAHIKRHDYLVNILQTVVETLLFFNPFVWMVSAITRQEREHCCDDLVLDHTREPLFYATALAALAAKPGQAPAFAVAASGQPNHLFNRIKRIMEMKKNSFSYSRMAAAIIIVATITCSIAWLSPSLGDKAKSGQAAGATPASKETVAPTTSKQEVAELAKPEGTVRLSEKTTTTTQTTSTTTTADAPTADQLEQKELIKRLTTDHLISEVEGFQLVKTDNKLFINGKQQSPEVASHYLSNIKQSDINITVYPFIQRLQMHPGTSLLQVIAPVTLSSGCVDNRSGKKPGC